MTPETRRRVFQYGIAIDLVIVATGIGLLYPSGALLLGSFYVGAVALAAWKGGWKGAATAIVLSVIFLPLFFGQFAAATPLFAFVAGSAVAAAVVRGLAYLSERRAGTASLTAENSVAFEPAPPIEPMAEEPLEDQIERARAEIARETQQKLGEAREAIRIEYEQRLEREIAALQEKADKKLEKILASKPAELEAEVEARYAKRLKSVKREAERMLKQRLAEEEQQAEAALQQRVAAEHVAMQSELEARLDRERPAIRADIDHMLVERVAAERTSLEAELEQRLAAEREALGRWRDEEVKARIAEEKQQAEAALQQRIAGERAAMETELDARLERERQAIRTEIEQAVAERLAAEGASLEAEVKDRLAAERETLRNRTDEELKARIAEEERLAEEGLQKRLEEVRLSIRARADARLAEAQAAVETAPLPPVEPATPATKPEAGGEPSMLDKIGALLSWRKTPALNFAKRKPASIYTDRRRPPPQPMRKAVRQERKPRLLLFERRRAAADTVAPKVKQGGVEVQIVERLVDAVDEIFRFKPDAVLIDSELPELTKSWKTMAEQRSNLPIFISGKSADSFAPPEDVRYVSFVTRPYAAEELLQIAKEAFTAPEQVLASQRAPRIPPPAPVPEPPTPVVPAELTMVSIDGESYEATCYHCRVPFDATIADWCSCLTKERTLVCTNCLTCFCKAPPAYKEKFWVNAPPRLFERKTAEAHRHASTLMPNVPPEEAKRPLVLSVEDNEDIQLIVNRVCTNLGYGFIHATNGQDGLTIARLYRPNLVLADAFMPKLDGREMCRILKEEPAGADCKMVVMTGLYTDTKYRSEALKRFHVDDYLSKPVAITDLINLLQKHLEGATDLPVQEDLHELHRQAIEEDGIPLSEILDAGQPQEVPVVVAAAEQPEKPRSDDYQVCCHQCHELFDATRAEWCTCLGRDQTVVCPHCHTCFCKAPAVYKERFWMDAPPSLFERKMIGSKRNIGGRANPAPSEVTRPLILLVEDDENIQLIVRTVVTTMGYGFIVGDNGQEGLTLAREYNPDLILSDAFMPKLDGREMCRLLKEDPTTARVKAIIMTGLYTDRKYRNEALDYFKVDDYVAKPLAVDDLIRLFKKYLPQEVQPTM